MLQVPKQRIQLVRHNYVYLIATSFGKKSTIFRPVHTVFKNKVIKCSAIYIQSNDIHNVVALIKFLLVLRFQLYMFRTVTVHPQELLCRYCICRLWYVVRSALPDTSSWYNVVGSSSYNVVYSIYKEAPEDGPLRSETCTAET